MARDYPIAPPVEYVTEPRHASGMIPRPPSACMRVNADFRRLIDSDQVFTVKITDQRKVADAVSSQIRYDIPPRQSNE